MSCVTQEVKDIFHLLEHEFHPSDLAVKALPLLTKVSKLGGKLSTASSVPEVQLSQYVPALERLATMRLLQQVHFLFFLIFCKGRGQVSKLNVCFFCLAMVIHVNVLPLGHLLGV